MTLDLLRTLFVVFVGFIGGSVGPAFFSSTWMGVAAGTTFGLVVVLADRLVKGITLRVFSSATFGLLLGMIFARLLLSSEVLKNAPEDLRWIAGLLVYATCAYFGMMVAMGSNRDEFALVIPYVRFRQAAVQEAPLIVDSNIIIDGRIAALCATGFVSSSLVVPRFVLEELQRLADSADPAKRERGRAALQRLSDMRLDPAMQVSVHETVEEEGTPTDTRLVILAKLLDARLLTNDGNLCSLARLQGVPALNLLELTKALKASVSLGEELELLLTKEGREPHQAVGYLADGTMVVVNHARQHLGRTVRVSVASTLPTSAGRLFFAELAGVQDPERMPAGKQNA